MTAAIFGLVGVVLGGIINILSNYFLGKSEIKEKRRIETKTKFDNHSRVLRKIGYEVDRYLDYTKTNNRENMQDVEELKQATQALLTLIEQIDESVLDGEGIKGYYRYLYKIREIHNSIPGNTLITNGHITALRKMNEGIKTAQINKKII